MGTFLAHPVDMILISVSPSLSHPNSEKDFEKPGRFDRALYAIFFLLLCKTDFPYLANLPRENCAKLLLKICENNSMAKLIPIIIARLLSGPLFFKQEDIFQFHPVYGDFYCTRKLGIITSNVSVCPSSNFISIRIVGSRTLFKTLQIER